MSEQGVLDEHVGPGWVSKDNLCNMSTEYLLDRQSGGRVLGVPYIGVEVGDQHHLRTFFN